MAQRWTDLDRTLNDAERALVAACIVGEVGRLGDGARAAGPDPARTARTARAAVLPTSERWRRFADARHEGADRSAGDAPGRRHPRGGWGRSLWWARGVLAVAGRVVAGRFTATITAILLRKGA